MSTKDPKVNTLWNEGVCEGLRIALVFVNKELINNPTSKKLKRIQSEIQAALNKEYSNMFLQTSTVTNGDPSKFSSGSIGLDYGR